MDLLVVARGLAVAGLLGTAGCATFRLAVAPAGLSAMPPDAAERTGRGLLLLARATASLGLAGLVGWTLCVTAALAAPVGVAAWRDGTAAVLGETTFGHLVLMQAALLLMALAVLGRLPSPARWGIAAALALAAAVLQLGHGHVWAMGGGLSAPVLSEALHLAAASVWLGGLPPLLLLTARAPAPAAAAVAARFSPIGMACVVVMAATASIQGFVLVGSAAALVHTAYGRIALVKIALFGLLVGLALLNRMRLVPALRADGAGRAMLLTSLGMETAVGLSVVLAAAALSQSPPGMSMPGM